MLNWVPLEITVQDYHVGHTPPLPSLPMRPVLSNFAEESYTSVDHVKWWCKGFRQARGCTYRLLFASVTSRVGNERQAVKCMCMCVLSYATFGHKHQSQDCIWMKILSSPSLRFSHGSPRFSCELGLLLKCSWLGRPIFKQMWSWLWCLSQKVAEVIIYTNPGPCIYKWGGPKVPKGGGCTCTNMHVQPDWSDQWCHSLLRLSNSTIS